MTIKVQALSEAELLATSGGDWDWGDFVDGVTWTLAAGCYFTVNPGLCGGALISGGIGLYL